METYILLFQWFKALSPTVLLHNLGTYLLCNCVEFSISEAGSYKRRAFPPAMVQLFMLLTMFVQADVATPTLHQDNGNLH